MLSPAFNSSLDAPATADDSREHADSTPATKTPSSGRHTCLHLYLAEIGKVQLLTPDQEIELAARIKTGDRKAREQMIKANLRLVVKIAHDFENLGLPLMDLISEGNIGLMKAVERFDPTKGAKLSTYASWWIKQAMKRALANQSKVIRLPVHMVAKISNLHRAARRLHEIFGREPSDEELATELGITSLQVAQIRVANNKPVSLDAPVGDSDSNTFSEIIEDQHAENPFSKLESKAVVALLRQLVCKLSQRESQILTARFGLDGAPARNLEEVGVAIGVTRERVRQIQNKALGKLRKALDKMDSPIISPSLAAGALS